MVAILYKISMENIKLETYKLISLDKITSTQDFALDMIDENRASDKTVVIATVQTGGRGRYKRKWISHSGNLYTSFIYKIHQPDSKLSYAVAVAVAETLIHFGMTPKIKWPNDILIDGKKICGILIEYAKDFVVVGIGINVNDAPIVSEYQTTKINNYINVTIPDLLKELIKNIDVWRNKNFESVRARFLELAIGINQKIKYRGVMLRFVGLNDDGALILNDGERDIFVYGDEIVV